MGLARTALVLSWLFASSAFAQAEPVPAQAARSALFVMFDASVDATAQAAMRAAFAHELNAELIEQPAEGVPTLRIARNANGQLDLTLQQNPAPLARSVPWSDDAAVLARDAALMAKNLVLDQTADLLKPVSEPSAAPAPPPAPPPPPQASDSELPPGFARKPPPVPAPRAPREGPRVVLLAAANPALAVEVSAPGASGSASTFAYGLHARADAPFGEHLAAGGGIALTTWENTEYSDYDYGLDQTPSLHATIVMDASAHVRAFLALGARAQLYAQLGAGPSTYSVMGVNDGTTHHSVTPYLGMNAALLAGASLRLARQLGAVLELGPSYHFMHGRDVMGDRVRAHALLLALQLGAMWVFDAY
jgi:hypothetical protein